MEIQIDRRETAGKMENFWSCIHFHPTDAIEDEWGQRILRMMAEDKAASFVRIYAMLEDIVSRDENGALTYDFSQNDMRIDFLAEQGFDLLICFNFMPDCIAAHPGQNAGLPRYKGKRVNNSVPADYREWEEVCYQYMRHLLLRYGEKAIARWRFHCWNEPDHEYWVSSKTCFDYQRDSGTDKLTEYQKLYDFFQHGMERACPVARVGGPSAAFCDEFNEAFVQHIAEGKNSVTGRQGTRLDFFTVHAYADLPYSGTSGKTAPENILQRVRLARELLDSYGYTDTEIIVDEWGAAAGGFLSIQKNPMMVLRENEYLPAFYFKLIDILSRSGFAPEKVLLCLSGQHKSVVDFDGYRSMFTLSGYKKPVYNGFCLAARLGEMRLRCSAEGCIPTVNEKGDVIVALYQLGDSPEKPPEDREIFLNVSGVSGTYTVRRSVIDRCRSNSYGAWQGLGCPQKMNREQESFVRDSGELFCETKRQRLDGVYTETITLSGNCVVLFELMKEREDETEHLKWGESDG